MLVDAHQVRVGDRLADTYRDETYTVEEIVDQGLTLLFVLKASREPTLTEEQVSRTTRVFRIGHYEED